MNRLFVLLFVVCLSFGTGCTHQLNDDLFALTETQCNITDKMCEFNEVYMDVLAGQVEEKFELLEMKLTYAESEQFLIPNTVRGDDGVDRVMILGEDGQRRAISVDDFKLFMKEASAARQTLNRKRAEFDSLLRDWERVVTDVRKSTQITRNMNVEINEKLKSAQRVLEDLTKVTATFVSTAAMFLLAG